MQRTTRLAGLGLVLITLAAVPAAAHAAPAPVGLHALARQAATYAPAVTIPGEMALVPRLRQLPEYPPAARRAGLDGRVRLKGTLTPEGTIADLRCISCEGDRAGFGAAALEAISGWSYEPVRTAGGQAVPISILFDVEFRH